MIFLLSYPQLSQGGVCDNPGNPCGESSISNPDACVGFPNSNGEYNCGGGGGGTTPANNEGSTCYSSANACGATSTGVIYNGTCSTKVQTGTNSKGAATYTYYPISTPNNPANYGVSCSSSSNSCGISDNGTIQCDGTCSVTDAPALPDGYGTSCNSASNACGVYDTGTIACSGSCSVTDAPALPDGYGDSCNSASNVCGVYDTGTIACSGSCSAVDAPALPDGYGESCQSAANSCGMRTSGVIQCSGLCSASVPSENLCAPDATVTVNALPSLVQIGAQTRIEWSSTDADTCTISGTNGDNWSGTSGSQTSSTITQEVSYTAICTGINTATTSEFITVKPVPIFHEF